MMKNFFDKLTRNSFRGRKSNIALIQSSDVVRKTGLDLKIFFEVLVLTLDGLTDLKNCVLKPVFRPKRS